MKITLSEPRYLKDPILIISEMVNEVNLRFMRDRIELVAMDPANVAMVVFKLLSSACSEYDVQDERVIGISLANFTKLLKRAKPSDVLSLELDERKNRLNVSLKGTSVRDFNLALLDIEEKEQKVPNLRFDVKVNTNTLLFNDAVEDMDIVADSLSFGVKDGRFVVESDGTISSGRIIISSDEETDIANKSGDDILSKYSIDYLKKIVKGAKLANDVMLEFSQDYPLKVTYKIVDKMNLEFILAPRVSSD